jgi:hypothetical protein
MMTQMDVRRSNTSANADKIRRARPARPPAARTVWCGPRQFGRVRWRRAGDLGAGWPVAVACGGGRGVVALSSVDAGEPTAAHGRLVARTVAMARRGGGSRPEPRRRRCTVAMAGECRGAYASPRRSGPGRPARVPAEEQHRVVAARGRRRRVERPMADDVRVAGGGRRPIGGGPRGRVRTPGAPARRGARGRTGGGARGHRGGGISAAGRAYHRGTEAAAGADRLPKRVPRPLMPLLGPARRVLGKACAAATSWR